MSDTPGAVERLVIDAFQGHHSTFDAWRTQAIAHDAEDARHSAVLRQAREALTIALGAITHESSTLMQRDLKYATEQAITKSLAAIDALEVR